MENNTETIFARKLLPCRQIESYSVIHLGEQKIFLNESGTRIWNLIDGKRSVCEIASTEIRNDSASESQIENIFAKVNSFFNSLYSSGLLFHTDSDNVREVTNRAVTSAPSLAHFNSSKTLSTTLSSADNRAQALQEVCMTPRILKDQPVSIADQIEKLYWERNYIQKMHLELTCRCNFRCVHCYNTTHSGAATELNTNEWMRALDQLADMGCWLLTFGACQRF